MQSSTISFLKKKKKQILEAWMNNQLADATLREDLISNDDLQTQSEDLLNALLKALNMGTTDLEAESLQPVIDILSDLSITRARQGFTPRETSLFVFSLKKTFNQILQQELKDNFQLLYQETIEISNMLDSLSIVTTETFIKGREEVILRQTDEISEISTPVIRVWEGILALPIIGTLDSARTQVVMENLLEKIVETGSRIAILDISGVPAVDSLVAQHLIKTVSATRLMGAECIISGIRAEIAQTIVHLGIDLSNIHTKASLASALKLAYSMLNIEVRRGEKKFQG
ncbi:STAS domain-containing protein [Adhaeribacter pallidiroseus]|uniref:RsbT co-antagonist protein RsbRA n=1 Tax=Adhaeribacter pallidiroseus TaxID=2072847 RepID=A0A369Q6R6_9BACT|nr:STAS domain-containing protein [Adhaeribacter pallidiroseus]RDC58826.1 RsbT co-antagonist protein RsbRA [Adhaeribacter pallidiroseus]